MASIAPQATAPQSCKPPTAKIVSAIAAGMIALGIVLALAGFAASGFNPNVFSIQLDLARDRVQLGGQVVEEPEQLPGLGLLLEAGSVDI